MWEGHYIHCREIVLFWGVLHCILFPDPNNYLQYNIHYLEKMAVETNSASFFIGECPLSSPVLEEEREEEEVCSLSSDSDEAADSNGDSLSSFGVSDGSSCLSIADTDSLSSFVDPDSDDIDKEDLLSSPMIKEEGDYPMSPKVRVTFPHFLQVPLTQRRGARKKCEGITVIGDSATIPSVTPPPFNAAAIAPPPLSSCSLRTNSAFSRFSSTTSDSNAVLSLDETSLSPPTNVQAPDSYLEWSHAAQLGEGFGSLENSDSSGVPSQLGYRRSRAGSEGGGVGDRCGGVVWYERTKFRLQRWTGQLMSRLRNTKCSHTYHINPQGEVSKLLLT